MKIRLAARSGSAAPGRDLAPDQLPALFPSGEEILETCLAVAQQGQPDGLVDLFTRIGVPADDLTATPFGARAALLGLLRGGAFYHHELRARIAMPPELEPELAVWGAGTVPEWRSGILDEPKYFSFFQDAPFAAYNPNYVGRWRSHELLHASQGFYWNPQMTRFEFYVGARVNELLPVVHWYGFDEMFRVETPGNGHGPSRVPAWWTRPPEFWQTHRDDALQKATSARAHLVDEWQACLQELDTSHRRETPRGRLNASSDAVGYLHGHWNRTTAWSFGAWIERFALPGVDYTDTLSGYTTRVARTALQLVDGDMVVRRGHWARLRSRRVLQDIGYRTLLALEWLDEGSAAARDAERALMPALDAAGIQCRELATGEIEGADIGDLIEHLFEAFDAVRHHFPGKVERAFRALGYAWPDSEAATGRPRAYWVMAGRDLLTAGMQSSCPETWRMLGGVAKTTGMAFAESERFDKTGRLADRFVGWLSDVAEEASETLGVQISGDVLERAAFEAWAGGGPRADEEADLFGAVPDGPEELMRRGGQLRHHATYRRGTFDEALVSDLVGHSAGAERDLIGVVRLDELRVMVVDSDTAKILDRIAAHRSVSTRDLMPLDNACAQALVRLIEHGFIVWLPLPR